ncbi:MAG: biliverdin-producing heme oxygenase, partial [Aeromonas sp.]
MSFYQTLQLATAQEREYLFNAPIIEACRRGEINQDHYLAFLTEAYYHVRHTVPLLMATGSKLGHDYEWVRGAI